MEKLGQSGKSSFLPKGGASASNLADQTLHEIRTISISTLTTLFSHLQREAGKLIGGESAEKSGKSPRRITFFSVGALVDPINLLPFSLGKELGDER